MKIFTYVCFCLLVSCNKDNLSCENKQQVPTPLPSNINVGESTTWRGDGCFNNGCYISSVLHDDKRQATCWIVRNADSIAISCLPDNKLNEAVH